MNHYEFYVDGDKFFDPRIDELALIDPVLELAKNCAGTLTFQIDPTHPKYDSFKPLTSTIEIYRDGEWFWEGKLISDKKDFYNIKNCVVEGALAYLNDSIQPQAEYHDMTVIGYVERLLNIHNSMVAENRKIFLGAVTVRDTNDSLYRYTNFNKTLPELREDVVDDLNGIFRVRKLLGKLYLDILSDFDRTCTQVIRFGENLIDLAPEFDYTDVASVIIPLGARLEEQDQYEEGLEALDKYVTIEDVNDGKNYIARDDLLEKYNKIWGKVQFQDVHVPDNLLKKAEQYLKDGQWGEMVIEAKAFDMNYTDEEFMEFRLGDRVRVISEVHGIDRFFPITAQTIHFNDIAENTITLGGTGEPVGLTSVTNDVTINTEKLDERIKDPNRLIQQAIYQATQLIEQGLNGYVRVDGNEILIMDTDNPETAKHVWRWNMGGLGYSNNGYHGPFETAMTMDGTIVGKFLAANSVAAEQIDVNYTSHVEKECNDYTDGKLTKYWTSAQTEVQLKTNSDSILQSVSTTYATRDSVGNLQERIQSTEQKITEDGIFTTINNGIAGSKSIHSTKFSMTKDGLTVDGGSIEILDGDFSIWNSQKTDMILQLDAPYNGGDRCLNIRGEVWIGYDDFTYINSNDIRFPTEAKRSITEYPGIQGGFNSYYTSTSGSSRSVYGVEVQAPYPYSSSISAASVGITFVPNIVFYNYGSSNCGTYVRAYDSGTRTYKVYRGYTGTLSSSSNLRVVQGLVVQETS